VPEPRHLTIPPTTSPTSPRPAPAARPPAVRSPAVRSPAVRSTVSPTVAAVLAIPPRVQLAPAPRGGHDTARASTGLTARDAAVIALLHRHRVLTALHLARLEFGSYSAARSRLALLHARGVLARFRRDTWPGSQSWRYTLGHVGALVHAAATGAPFPRPATITDTVLRLAHSSHTEHRLGVNTFFTTIAGHTRHHPGTALVEWASEAEAAELCGGILRPDGYATYTETIHRTDGGRTDASTETRTLRFFYEHDTGTETLDTLLDKITTYGELATAGLAHPVLIELPGTRREHHLHDAIARRWPAGAPAAVATLPADQLAPTGRAITPAAPSPLDALWLPAGHTHRRTLAHLALARLAPAHLDPPARPARRTAGRAAPTTPTTPTAPATRRRAA
jgi:hypothetical protein